MVIDWPGVKGGVSRWVETVLGVPTHWSGQAHGRPDYPYVALDIVSGPRAVHHDSHHILEDGDAIVVAMRGDREVTFSLEPIVQFTADQPYAHDRDAFALAEELRSSLEREASREILREAGVSIVDSRGSITNRRTILDVGFLSRAGFDLVTGLAACHVPATAEGAMERVHIESTLAGRPSNDRYGGSGDPTPL